MMAPAMALQAAVLSLFLASVFFLMLRLRAPRWTFVVLGVLPSATLLVALPNLRVSGYHAWVHAGLVYQILMGHVPPQNPLLAGEPAHYPWVHALLLAGISKLLGVSPFWSASFVAIASLAILLVLTYRIGRIFTPEIPAAVFGVAASLYAFTFTQSVPDSPIRRLLTWALPLPFFEPRGTPILEEFNGCTGFPLGLALYALVLVSLLTLVAEGRPRRGLVIGLGVGSLGVGFVYPFLLPSVLLLCLAACGLVWRHKDTRWRQIAAIGGALLFVGAAVMPYYRQLAVGRAESALKIASLPEILRPASVLFVTLLPMVLLVLWARKVIRRRLCERSEPAALIGMSVAFNLLLFVFVSAPLWSQYKFLLLGIYSLGIVGGLAFHALCARAWPVAFLVFSLFLFSFGLDCAHKASSWRSVPESFRESGVALDHADRAENDLYQWIRSKTGPNSVFVDSKLVIPVFGQRALFVGLGGQTSFSGYNLNGYTLDAATMLLIVDGYERALVTERQRIATKLLSGEAVSAAELASVRATGDSAFLVARTEELNSRPLQGGAFRIAFRNTAATLWGLARPGGRPASAAASEPGSQR
jgi:hypothetical protein